VRSGQKIVAERGDLVVCASVGSGAELVAVGNIHVYGALRGRALAGVNGDETARIFCQHLDAELLAIAGLYRTSEDLGPDIRKQRIQAFLQEEKLVVEALQ
jgi:septum site-determining protein MinC